MDIIENSEAMTDAWEDIDLSDLTAEEAPETDQTAGQESTDTGDQTGGGEEQETGTEENSQETDQSFTLKHLDETRTVGREEVIALAQKGMDYDRVRAKLDAKTELENAEAAQALEFVKMLAQKNGGTMEDFMDAVTAGMRAKPDRSDYDSVLAQVKMERREKALDEREQKLNETSAAAQQQNEAAAKRQADIKNFMEAFPDVKAENIPKEVWTAVAGGKTLVEAYALHEAARLKNELAAEKQNTKNKARSTGSRATAGKSDTMDDFDQLWYDGT